MDTQARPRYAIYYTPPADSVLWRFGSSVIGYDSVIGADVHPQECTELADVLTPEILADPRRYGFHATLRAPFELTERRSVDQLLENARSFAAIRQPVLIGKPKPALLDGFIALVCEAPPDALYALAGDCVRAFEPFRRPLSDADRQRRLDARLTPRQLAHLDAWGYPYVHEDFLFHMTLTGKVSGETGRRALDILSRLYAPLAQPIAIDAVSVLVQPCRSEPFRLINRFPFAND